MASQSDHKNADRGIAFMPVFIAGIRLMAQSPMIIMSPPQTANTHPVAAIERKYGTETQPMNHASASPTKNPMME